MHIPFIPAWSGTLPLLAIQGRFSLCHPYQNPTGKSLILSPRKVWMEGRKKEIKFIDLGVFFPMNGFAPFSGFFTKHL